MGLQIDDLAILIRAAVLGFSIAAPVGPIGLLCIRRTLAEGQLSGLVSGLGAATADSCYGIVAAFGLTLISDVLIGQKAWLGLIGGLFLCYLGVSTFLSKPAQEAANVGSEGLWSSYLSTLFLTITNPLTILSFAAVFAGLGLAAAGSYLRAGLLVSGVFIGSAAWWLMLSGGVSLFRSKFDRRALLLVNRISGLIILGSGVLALLSLAA